MPSTIPARQKTRLFNRHQEKRARARRNVKDLSQIRFANHMIGCLVHNISEDGAMIEVSTHQVPDSFILANYRTKKRVICKVMWRDNLHLGVKFVTKQKLFCDGFT